mmetsp:Transcript_129900/g.183198  ORF Transcript_129900/g.183198 Transcript_129900/m.183198 type:complete len:103 (-) Transcript_129900:70-378(-)
MLTELLGAVACLVTAFFVRSCRTSADWHLYIRRMCHLSRWVFRGFHEGWALKRNFPVDIFDKDDEVQKSEQHAVSNQSTTTPDTPTHDVVIVDHITYDDEKK